MVAIGGRRSLLIVVVAVAIAAMLLLPRPGVNAQAAVISLVVDATSDLPDTNPSDGLCLTILGDCTLRAAIEQGNQVALGMTASITFSLPAGPAVIPVSTPLPAITKTVIIDAGDRPASTTISGGGATTGPGMRIQGAGSAVYGLTITGFKGAGIYVDGADDVTIGGLAAGEGNVIFGNGADQADVYVVGPASEPLTGIVIQGNRLGLLSDGSLPATPTRYGVWLVATEGALVKGNTISGHQRVVNSGGSIDLVGYGIYLEADATGSTIAGNRIGTDPTGTLALPNYQGVWVSGSGTTIGGTTVAERNLISGNTMYGLFVGPFSSQTLPCADNRIAGNYIGTDASGTSAIPNYYGIVAPGGTNLRIGGTEPGAANVISGNSWMGVSLGSALTGAVIEGNFIGTVAGGGAPLGNANAGIFLQQTSGVLIGGTAAGAGNVIGGNGRSGIGTGVSKPTDAPGIDNRILGNYVGVGKGGEDIGNDEVGIRLTGSAQTKVGGVLPGEANRIAHNGSEGVLEASVLSVGNQVRGNAIFANGTLGIDLADDIAPDGATPNDAGDLDTGPNGWQNHPALTKAVVSPSEVVVQGVLESAPSTMYAVDVYWNSACDGSGYGEGAQYLGVLMAVTDASGEASFAGPLSATVPGLGYLTATATDPSGSTSEFSACRAGSEPDPTVTPTTAPSPTPSATPAPPAGRIFVPQVSKR